jgi:hypothetical protein
MTAAICAGFFTMAALILIIVLAYDVSLAYGIALFGLVWFGLVLVWFGCCPLSLIVVVISKRAPPVAGGRRQAGK